MKKLKENIIGITSFPSHGEIHGEHVVGIASYAKNTFSAMRKQIDAPKIEVLAEKLPTDQDYTEKGISVKRVWKRNSFVIFPRLFKEVWKRKETKNVVIEFELSMFGGLIYLLPLPLFLAAIKIIGKKITFVNHQVIPDMNEIAPHINIQQKSFKADFASLILKSFYIYLIAICDKVIVFEEDLKEKLPSIGKKDNVVVIPHGVEIFKNYKGKIEARKKLKIQPKKFVIMSFGFLAWYKGTDWLVEEIKKIKTTRNTDNIQLVLAGGPNPNNSNRKFYERYVRGIRRVCKENGFILTGFVPEEKIPLYFKAADLVVLPYRTFMSSSGPLSIALSFGKPFLVSEKLSGLFASPDLKNSMQKNKLKEDDLSFENVDFSKKIKKLLKNKKLMNKMSIFSKDAGKARSWDRIGKLYNEAILS